MKFAKHEYIDLPRPQQPFRLRMQQYGVNPYYINMAVTIDMRRSQMFQKAEYGLPAKI